MILVDTSVWLDHFRTDNPHLERLLQDFKILTHPLVIGEVACGNLRDRSGVLAFFRRLPSASVSEHREALQLLEDQHLWGTGLGWIDVHLLASTLLSGCELWTLDQSLHRAANSLKVAYRNRPWIS